MTQDAEDNSELTNEERIEQRRRAFEVLYKMVKRVPIEDEKKVLAEYRDERYGRS